MKKISKILSSVLAASLALSCMAMNVMAASKAHTVTVSADKTNGLVAGDSVVVEVKIDNTASIVACEYALTYDSNVFEVDTTKGQKIGMKKYENCLDIDWYKAITDGENSPWQVFVGAPTYSFSTAGKVSFAWAGSEGIDPEYSVDNDVIGKFTLKVKSDAKNGSYTLGLTGNTMDIGENLPTDLVSVPVTVKVGEDAPVVPEEPEITINDKYVFKFTAEEGQDVMVTLKRTNGITSDLTYALPKDVKGTASIFGLLKVVDATVVSGDIFDIAVVDANRNVVKPITTITVD